MATSLRTLYSRSIWTIGLSVAFLAATGFFPVHAQKTKDGEQAKPKPPIKKEDDKKPKTKVKPVVDRGPGQKEADGEIMLPQMLRGVVREGYTRPGNPPDEITEKGTIRRVAFEREYRGIGGTVYFLVLELNPQARDGDRWGTGIADFDRSFITGRDYRDNYSPPLDTRAKYLYLYQVVNDRGLDPVEIRPAADQEINSVPIATAMVRLRVDPRYITSWGYFRGKGFVLKAPDRRLDGGIVPAADGEVRPTIVAVSAAPPVIGILPEQAYRRISPAYSLNHMLGIGTATFGLKDLTAIRLLRKNQAAGKPMATGLKNMVRSAETAIAPDFVRLAYTNFDERLTYALGEEAGRTGQVGQRGDISGTTEAQLVFRADWIKNNQVQLGQHSTLFGFTTDLPPVDEPLLVADAVGAGRGAGGILPAVGGAPGTGPGTAPGTGTGILPAAAIAPGTVPAPAGAPAGVAFAAPGGAVGGLGGQVAGGGGGGLVGGAIPAGFGQAGPSTAGGGGFGGGTGGGSSGSEQGREDQTGQEQGTRNDINIQVNVNQTQSQQQSQKQNQSQSQSQSQNGGGEVIPEPAAFLLGLLGLPVLYLAVRRRRAAAPLAS